MRLLLTEEPRCQTGCKNNQRGLQGYSKSFFPDLTVHQSRATYTKTNYAQSRFASAEFLHPSKKNSPRNYSACSTPPFVAWPAERTQQSDTQKWQIIHNKARAYFFDTRGTSLLTESADTVYNLRPLHEVLTNSDGVPLLYLAPEGKQRQICDALTCDMLDKYLRPWWAMFAGRARFKIALSVFVLM